MAAAVPLLPEIPVAMPAFDNTPVLRLRDFLIDAKRGHEDFDVAWTRARRLAVRGLAQSEQSNWLRVFDDTQHEWRACYNGTASTIPRLMALQNLGMGAAA